MFEELVGAGRQLADSVDVAGLDGDACVALAVAAQRVANVFDALKLRAVAELRSTGSSTRRSRSSPVGRGRGGGGSASSLRPRSACR